MRHPIVIFSPCLALGTPENELRPLLGPREGRGEASNSDFLCALGVGDPRECRGYVAIPPSFGPLTSARRKSELATSPLPSRGPKRGRNC